MAKKLLAVSLVLLLALVAFGCAQPAETPPAATEAAPPSEAPVQKTPEAQAPGEANGDLSAAMATAQARIDEYSVLPEFKAPGPAFDARAAMEGKTILTIPETSANAFPSGINECMANVAQKVGFDFQIWTNQGLPNEWQQGMESAINRKVDLIDLVGGSNPAQLKAQIEMAQAAGIKVVSSHLSGHEQEVPYVDANVTIDYLTAGKLMADWAIVHTNGKPNVVYLGNDEVTSTHSLKNGIESEFQALCPDAVYEYINVPTNERATKVQSELQNAILRNPDLNYVIPIYDVMTQFSVPAVEITQSADRVKIISFNGNPFALEYLQQGKIEMDVGENLDWIAHGILDSEMRLLAGLEVPADPCIPLYIWDKSNAANAGNPPGYSTGYGDAYVKGYNELWGLQ